MTVAGKSERSKQAACELGWDGSEEAFDEALRKVALLKPTDEMLIRSPKSKC